VQEVPPAPQARRGAVAAPAPSPSREVEPAPGPRSSLDRSITLSAEGRFAEAARAAHEGLANGEDPGPLLVALSRVHLARGQIDQAIATARDALFVSRSRDSVAHLIRVLTRTRRFGPEDGPLLRRAAARHPERAMLRHALGVFESMHGDAGAARDQLLAALQLETQPQERQAIERDLHRTQPAAS
jgi:thioredoxin-like negative regulator of GroEL